MARCKIVLQITIVILFVGLFSQRIWAQANTTQTAKLKEFVTDGCSASPDGKWEEGWNSNAWKHCCIIHDIDYWKGGTYEKQVFADDILKVCIDKSQGHSARFTDTIRGGLYKLGVIIGGKGYSVLPWRWGYGWPQSYALKPYRQLTRTESMHALTKLQVLNKNIDHNLGVYMQEWELTRDQVFAIQEKIEKEITELMKELDIQ